MPPVTHTLIALLGIALTACPAPTPAPEGAPTPATPVAEGTPTPATPVAEGTPPTAAAPTKAEGAAKEAEAPKEEVLFDPAHPPTGFSRCQGGACYARDGRILTYKQVMAEMGASRMVGSIDPAKLPEAPSDVAAAPEGATTTASGLATRVLKAGSGEAHPGPKSTVQVHYSGWTTDGEAFDSSIARGRPAAFPLDRVIAGWQEAIQLMVVGEKRRLWIPEALAYKGKAGGPPGMLVFDVELLQILSP